MEGPEPFQGASSCDRFLKAMQPLTAISADDLQTLDSPTMLNSYEHDMLLSGLPTLSSTLSISSNELCPHLEQWDLTSMSNYTISRLHQEFSTERQGDFLSQSMENARETGQNMKGEADRPELDWCQKQTHIQMDAGLPNHVSDAKSKGLSVIDSPPGYRFSRAHPCKDLLKLLDSSDNSDSREDVNEDKPSHGEALMSRNVALERRRREKLNERLYALRAMVPNISKMDKASIVGDAISYIHDLQKQGEAMQADIANLQCAKDAILAGAVVHPKKDAKRCGAVDAGGIEVLEEYRVAELEVNQMEEQIYHLRINCEKKPAVLAQLARAVEALEFEIINASLIAVNDHTVNTIVVKVQVKNGELFKTATEVRKMTLEVIQKFGLQLKNTLY